MFYGHHARPVSLAWSPDNEHFATGGMDMLVFVWAVGDADNRIRLPGKTCIMYASLTSTLDINDLRRAHVILLVVVYI